MKPSSIKAWLVVHEWTSLICTAFMLLLCVTGLPLIFAHEIDHALGHSVDPPETEGVVGAASIDRMIEDATARTPGHEVQFLVGDPEEPALLHVRMGESLTTSEASAFYTYDNRTGEFLGAYPLNEGVMQILLRLHVDMFAGLPGTLFLGAMGLLLLVSIVSGVVLYAPYMRKLRFGTVRRERSRRLHWLDVHNLLGIVTLVWLFVVGATGVVNTLAIPIFRQWQSTELSAMLERHENSGTHADMERAPGSGSAERVMDAVAARAPDLEMSFVAFPGTGFAGPDHFVAYMRGKTPWTSKLLTPVLVDGRTGAVLERGRLPWYVSALLLSQPLHFGDYGGMSLKVLWALLDLLAIAVLVTGLYLWVRRRRTSLEARVRAVRGEDSASEAWAR